MPETFKPLKAEDFDFSTEEMRDLVLGAQRFVSPEEDPQDAERLTAPEFDEPL